MTSVTSDVVIAGMSRALVDGVDVISMSLGGANGWANSASALVASRISKLGVPVVISAGNSGTTGAFYASSTGSSEFSLNIASVQNSVLLGFASKVTGVPELTDILALASKPLNFTSNATTTLPLYATSKTPVLDDACKPLPADLKLEDKVVLVLRGNCSLAVKQKNVLNRGAKYFIWVNAKPPLSIQYPDSLNDQQQTIGLTYDEGIKLQAAFAAGKDVRITFDPAAVLESRANKQDGGFLSSFTNFGPTNEMLFTPHIAGPG